MDISAYLVLIAALFGLAAVMLYSRFASRSREKSLHHGPSEAAFAIAAVSSLSDEEVPEPAGAPSGVRQDIPSIKAAPIEDRETSEKNGKDVEYLDELQEAAAGLAMLMRSSAANRSTPVVFAPPHEEEEEPIEEEFVVEEKTESAPEAESATAAEEFPEETPLIEEEATLAVLLGTEVADRIERIDSGLDALENLIGSIESGIAALEPFDDGDFGDPDADSGSEDSIVSEAA